MHPVLFQIGPLVVPSYGAVTALGILLALGLAHWAALRAGLDPEVGPRHAWNMLVLAVFAAIAIERLLLIMINLSDLRKHPQWLLAVAMVHHPLLSGVGIAAGVLTALGYARWAQLPLKAAADCLAAPFCLALAAEQFGALMAGSDYGRVFGHVSPWAVTYTSTLAARWSGTPLGIPLYPAQAYAAAGDLALAALLVVWLHLPRRAGDAAAVCVLSLGVLLFITEIFRDWEGRGAVLGGVVDIPQLVGLGLVVLGGMMLGDWRRSPRAPRTKPERPADV